MLGNGRNAPIPDLLALAPEWEGSTQSRRQREARHLPPVTKTAPSTLSSANGQRLLGGLHERVEARLHHLITRFAHPGIADRRWHLKNVPYCHSLALNPFDTRLAAIEIGRASVRVRAGVDLALLGKVLRLLKAIRWRPPITVPSGWKGLGIRT